MSVSNSSPESAFTTTDFLDTIKETIGLANEIINHKNVVNNEKIQDLIKIQCCNALNVLNKLNKCEVNFISRGLNFANLKLGDNEKIAKLIEINDALIDKTIHYISMVKNVKEKKSNPNLIQVQMNVDEKSKNSKIYINDYKKNNNLSTSSEYKHKNFNKKIMFMAAANVKRPQIAYNIKVNNSYSAPFIPCLTNKPNSSISLEESLNQIPQQITAPIVEGKKPLLYPSYNYSHPYEYEIENLSIPEEFFNQTQDELKKPKPLDKTELVFINKRDELYKLVELLKNYKEIAVDVEHHSFRSYQGLTCLLQLSTDDADYIIDVFSLWKDMEILNEIFTKPSILKVFHSATFDIIWLQRDFGIYVVNMFDTYLAAQALNYSHLSLSALVERFCGLQLDKRFQLADWRIRPIPTEMLHYARCDTHSLLYIYRILKQELLNNGDNSANLLRLVMNRSQRVCLKRYEKKLLDANEHVHLLWKNNLRFNKRQLSALKSLYFWRDNIARFEDESVGYVLPNNLLLKICEILPREQQGILACCNPIPPLVRQYINEIHKKILNARSYVSNEEQSPIISTNQMKMDMTIDLTNDIMMDHNQQLTASMKIVNNEHNENISDVHEEHHDTPLLQWSNDIKKFIPNEEQAIKKSAANHNDRRLDNDKKRKSLINAIGNHKRKKVSDTSMKSASNNNSDNNIDKIFDGYMTFYQKYLRKLEQKNEMKAD